MILTGSNAPRIGLDALPYLHAPNQKQMALLEDQLVVKRSQIPNSGKGLFTKKFIPKGTRIVEYKGNVSAWKDVDHKDGSNGYIYFLNRNHVIDALPTPEHLARYANDARGLSKIKGINNNCNYVNEKKQVYIESYKDIPAGGEILVNYGKDYWDTIRENIRIEKEKQKAAVSKKQEAASKKMKSGSGTKGTKKSSVAKKK